MNAEYYKVSGRFEVYDKRKTLITDQFFLNKIFEALLPRAARNIAVAYIKRRAAKKYGKRTVIEQTGNLVVRKSHAPVKKKKKRENTFQGKSF